MFTKTTKDIKVTVLPHYLEQQSEPEDDCYVWAYTVQLENHSKENIKLLNRHWKITDALGRMQEVRGEGVVGETPTLKPSEAFRYTSGVPLKTPSGFMVGEYEMAFENGEKIEVQVPAFSLDSPFGMAKPN